MEGRSMSEFRDNIAVQVGVNAALVAEYLWYLLMNEASGEDAFLHQGKYWCRCSARMITAEMPFLSRDMVSNATLKLRRKGYIRKSEFNDDRFDRTSWYTFTDYGVKMMEAW
jgi:hypothetical protein